MNFYVMTLFPEMIQQGMQDSILGRASRNGVLCLNAVNIRDYTEDKHKKVDDYPYGGGAGMLMQAQPVYDCYKAIRNGIASKKGDGYGKNTRVVYLTPKGKTFHQKMAEELAKEEDIIFLCGHYEGIDERVLEEIVTDYVSIGDYILTGGELPALVMIDAIARLVPGVLNNEASADVESFYNDLLEYPQYSRPEQWHGKGVPPVLLSGNHKKIKEWRLQQSEKKTQELRPDLYDKYSRRKNLAEKLAQKNKALYADMSESLRRGLGELVYEGEDGAVVLDENAGTCFLAAFLEQAADKIVETIPIDADICQFVLHQKWLMPSMERSYRIVEKNVCRRAIYTQKIPLAVPKNVDIRRLDKSYLEEFSSHYSMGSKEYIEERLENGSIYGAFLDNKLAGFAGEHIEGSLGMLEVYKEYRRCGIGESLEAYMINHQLSKGYLPYGDVIEGNEPSYKLQQKLGLKITKETFCWVVIEK